MNDLNPPYDELADDEDELDWSWDALTGGEREELSDDDALMVALFAGVDEKDLEQHVEDLKSLLATPVAEIQEKLAGLGYTVEVNGEIDAATTVAIKRFQKGSGLRATGTLDAATTAAIFAAR